MPVHPSRIRQRRIGQRTPGAVVYWMSRDQRAHDNWALLYAQELALETQAPLCVVFCLVPEFLHAQARHFDFLLRGMQETAATLRAHRIGFFLRCGDPAREVPAALSQLGAGALVMDFDPLRIKRQWQEKVVSRVRLPCYEVDAHNVVPCQEVSPKAEYGAYTLRPKLHKRLAEFLTSFPGLIIHPYTGECSCDSVPWEKAGAAVRAAPDPGPVPGEAAAAHALRYFIRTQLRYYPLRKNDPALQATSGLSPYLHFGHIASQRVALAVQKALVPRAAKEAFLEELIVRKELSDNFCLYTPRYDSLACLPEWAANTLEEHARDPRPYVYSLSQLEEAHTHDPYWNACQQQMMRSGLMHGYMRMYWGKKVLEWSRTAEEAFSALVYLNDKYELDGRDPNGYAGIAWCFGMHDRAWPTRPVFGKVRYMNAAGLERKYDMQAYLERIRQAG
jgi:deoxyribodipyrimidine photo-lyase